MLSFGNSYWLLDLKLAMAPSMYHKITGIEQTLFSEHTSPQLSVERIKMRIHLPAFLKE